MSDLDQQLIDAAEEGDLDGVREALADGADVHAEGDYALQKAASAGGLAIVQWLLEAGADVLADNSLALRWAAEVGHHEIVQCLLEAGADLHSSDDNALRLAAEFGHAAVVACLIAAGADVRIGEDSPLVLAARNGQIAAMKLLIPHGVCELALMELPQFPHAAQVILLETVDVSELSATTLAGDGLCPAALCVLLERQGNTELAAMFSATQMLDPLTPAARAALLGELQEKIAPLAQHQIQGEVF